MAGTAAKATANASRARKRVEAESATLKRARDGSAFTRCEACNKDVPVVLIDMHSCSLDSKIRMNLEAQVVEKTAEVQKPEKKRASPSAQKKRSVKRKKAVGSGKRKRAPTAFFIFMDDFRKEYKAANPDSKGGAAVAKEGGERWKSMTDEEKKPYIEKAAELKAEYEKAVQDDDDAEDNAGDEGEASETGENEDEKEVEKEEDKEEEKNELDDDI